jgi:hypothetical protein
MHIRAGMKGSVGFVIFEERFFLETLDCKYDSFRIKIVALGCPNQPASTGKRSTGEARLVGHFLPEALRPSGRMRRGQPCCY